MKILFKIIAVIVLLTPLLLVGLVYLLAPDRYNILIVGSDQRGEERARSDVLMVFSIPKSPKQATSLITIPRDSRVDITGHGQDKITHAYVYGDLTEKSQIGNIELTQKTVENLLDIEVSGTVEFTFESFKEIVDLVGGVWTEDGHYDGEEALAMVRDRYRAGGDFARTADQREVFKAVLTKLKNKDTALSVFNKLKESSKAEINIDTTSAGMFGVATYIRRFGRLSLGDIETAFVPGEGSYIYSEEFGQKLYYWVIDEKAKDELVEKNLR